jgi:hypothetical protein
MKSGALNHFPPVVYREGKRVLWNLIERKPHVNRPEERIRLKYIDYLTLECGWPLSRIASESAISVYNRESQLRADLICYDKYLKPAILIECKSESVSLSNRTADQTALYNHAVHADLICITNGIEDLWFKKIEDTIDVLKTQPIDKVRTLKSIRDNPGYWQTRGFLGAKLSEQFQSDITRLLNEFWSPELNWKNRFLRIQHSVPEFTFEHYYRLIDIDEHTRMALSFIGGLDGYTYFVAIYNIDGNNRALLISSLYKILTGSRQNSELITSSGSRDFDLRKIIPFRFPHFNQEHIANIPGFLNAFFVKSI